MQAKRGQVSKLNNEMSLANPEHAEERPILEWWSLPQLFGYWANASHAMPATAAMVRIKPKILAQLFG